MRRRLSRWVAGAALTVVCAGCATPPLEQARRQFNDGYLDRAEASLADIPEGKDQVLLLMERGMVRHLRHDYEGSTRDWLLAARLEEKLETHSVSKAGASMVINDTALAFRGYPYERALLHVFTARNYLARALWDDAAVEALNALRVLERLDGYPDDPYSRYVTGLCLELAGDDSNAGLQYRLAGQLAPDAAIEESTGRFLAPTGGVHAVATTAVPPNPQNELVCLVDIDGTAWGPTADYAEIVAGGRVLGRSRTLTHLVRLQSASAQREAVKRMTKSMARVAFKETLASLVATHNEDLGEVLRLLLFAVESPDTRRWDTLPARLAVARVPCPANLSEFEVVYHSAAGVALKRVTMTRPLSRKGRVFFAYCRDAP